MREIKAGIGVLARGTVLASGTGGDIGKLVPLTASTEAAAYGVLLDAAVDTGQAFSNGSVTGSIARAGSFRGAALVVANGVDPGPGRGCASRTRDLHRRADYATARCGSRH